MFANKNNTMFNFSVSYNLLCQEKQFQDNKTLVTNVKLQYQKYKTKIQSKYNNCTDKQSDDTENLEIFQNEKQSNNFLKVTFNNNDDAIQQKNFAFIKFNIQRNFEQTLKIQFNLFHLQQNFLRLLQNCLVDQEKIEESDNSMQDIPTIYNLKQKHEDQKIRQGRPYKGQNEGLIDTIYTKEKYVSIKRAIFRKFVKLLKSNKKKVRDLVEQKLGNIQYNKLLLKIYANRTIYYKNHQKQLYQSTQVQEVCYKYSKIACEKFFKKDYLYVAYMSIESIIFTELKQNYEQKNQLGILQEAFDLLSQQAQQVHLIMNQHLQFEQV